MTYKIHTVDGQVYDVTATEGWQKQDVLYAVMQGVFVTPGNFVPYHSMVRIEFAE